MGDRRIEAMIKDVQKKLALRAEQQENPALPGLPDEEDAKAIVAMHDKAMDSLIMKRCKEEKEGKCRCCYRYCNKLFKGIEFLRKHLKSKHPDFAEDDFVAISAPFMRTRFEADDISARPLPPVYVETKGRAEVKSVKEILEKVMVASSSSAAAAAASSMMMLPPPLPAGMGRMGGFDQQQGFRHHAGGGSGGGRGGGEFRKRGHDPRDQRAAGMHSSGRGGGGGFGPQSQAAGQYVEPRSEDNHSRKIASYLDVDAPKESAVSVDYGVALLPPTKKRKVRKSM